MSNSTTQQKTAALLLAANAGIAATTYFALKTLVRTALDRKMPPIMEHNRKKTRRRIMTWSSFAK